MQCTRCSNPLHETARFCERCGTPVAGVTADRLMTHPDDMWTYGGSSPGSTESQAGDARTRHHDDAPTWSAPAPGADETSTWSAAPGVDETSSWRRGPVDDVPPVWGDDRDTRTRRTARTVGAVTLVVLAALGGTATWAVTRGGGTGGEVGAALPTTAQPVPPLSPAGRSDDPYSAGPSTAAQPVPGTGSVTGGTPGTGSSSVTIGPAAATDPDAVSVAELLGRHVDAINSKDFDAWVATVTPRRSREQTEARWRQGYRSTYNTGMELRSLTVDGSGTRIATVAFTSTQDPADAPDRTSSRLCWVQHLPIEGSASSPLIGLPDKGSTRWDRC